MDEEYSGERHRGHHHEPKSTSELMASGKIMAAAAQSAMGGKMSSIDKAGVAGAAEDFLGAAQQYGKFDETAGMGKYVSKAEDYLHKYHSSNSQEAGDEPVSDRRHHRREENEGDYDAPVSDRPHNRRDEENEGGYDAPVSDRRHNRREEENEGDYDAPAPDHRRHEKESRYGDEEKEESGAGVGEYINMAKGFFK